MDIASVYLNLASLLGTEVEVEGYYRWGMFYTAEGEQESLRIALPQYMDREGVLTVKHVLNGAEHWTKATLRGYLNQNRQGEPLLNRISSVRYTNAAKHVDYQAMLTHDGLTVTCAMQADLSMTHKKFLIDETRLQNMVVASQSMSNNVLLKGSLIPPKRWEGNFSFQSHNLAMDRRDLKGTHVDVHNNVWVQDKQSEALNEFFGPTVPGGYSYWQGKNIQFLVAGQLAYFDGNDKEGNHPDVKHRLQFTSLHHVRLNHMMTFQRPQDERL